ncbi:hypothetical protein IVB27_32265 [Bradyrhizobium sp. 197]|uniref:hypothetical protein n=1 Tax=Bradyrhizobium sp. 197 TaxID=2782663 RepID=UPI001FFBC8EA|nr:hypothetical protein [Bradyrhizobium sp. 197]MCK1479289.1 hypothetical protein [Bradyrhizobium sp. 197]
MTDHLTRAQIESRIAELKVENEKAPGGAGTNARAELIRELEAQLPCSADTAAYEDTDDAEVVKILAAVRHCANSWDGSARLVGNVRARDISRACTAAISSLAQAVGVSDDEVGLEELITDLRREKLRLREALEAVQSEIVLTGHLADIVDAALSQPSPAATVETKSAPELGPSQNNAERLPQGDQAGSGAGTHLSADTGRQRAIELLIKLQTLGNAEVYRLASEAQQMLELPISVSPQPPSKMLTMLAILDAAGGQTEASDSKWCWLNYFCEDAEPTDTFNRAVDAKLIRVTHDSRFDSSTAYLTDAGRAASPLSRPEQS